ncbi:MAG TPA: septal ring lytic transglycosylase RlpA family protein [Terriglobales bacterium]|nr:septal ring lytic transglycosylase RlpA family protein [Terriglobales bacterium]
MRRVLIQSLLAFLLASTLGAAPGQPYGPSAKQSPANAPKAPASIKPSKPYQVGEASWYGKQFHGKETASGESYDMFRFTAAHPTLPLGSWIRVTNLRNHKSVIVRINDRGPVVPGRIMDLSYGAAQVLGMRGRGVTKVRLDIVQLPEVAQNGRLEARNGD